MESETILSFQDVSFGYEEHLVLKKISFQIKKGEFVGVIGPNGGGKTTLLKLIMGFLKPKSGVIKIFGENPKPSCQNVAYVPQTLRYDRQFPISVMELVLSGRLSHLPWYGLYSKKDEKAAHEALEKVHLSEFKNRAFGTLSSGQAQRALIARALVGNPQLLLLDEPTASVDAKAETDIYNILNELKGAITMLMVTHDLQATINQVERVLCVQGSLMILKPEEVCEHFAIGLYHKPLIQLPKE